MIWENPAGKTEAQGNLHGKDSTQKAWRCYKEAYVFLLPTLKEQEGFEPFGTDNFVPGHLCRDPKSRASLVALASARRLEKNQHVWFTAALLAPISDSITTFCLRLFEISSSEPSGLYTTTLPDTLLLKAEAFLLTVYVGIALDFLLTENQGFQINFLWNDGVVLLFHRCMAPDCESTASGSDGSRDAGMKLLPRQAVSNRFCVKWSYISCFP